jgi:signal transduction histidine kinase
MSAQEQERRRIARELHDEIGQALTAVKINLEGVKDQPEASSARAKLEDSIALTGRTLQQVRDLSLDLRPSLLDDLGLVAALRWYLERQAQRTGFAGQLIAEDAQGRLSPELETVCFRVAQEALTNVARHAHAAQVQVELRAHQGSMELIVRDDGVGFDVPAARDRATRGTSLGLLGMQERVTLAGGRIEITSAFGQRTEVRAWFPLAEPQTDSARAR